MPTEPQNSVNKENLPPPVPDTSTAWDQLQGPVLGSLLFPAGYRVAGWVFGIAQQPLGMLDVWIAGAAIAGIWGASKLGLGGGASAWMLAVGAAALPVAAVYYQTGEWPSLLEMAGMAALPPAAMFGMIWWAYRKEDQQRAAQQAAKK